MYNILKLYVFAGSLLCWIALAVLYIPFLSRACVCPEDYVLVCGTEPFPGGHEP